LKGTIEKKKLLH